MTPPDGPGAGQPGTGRAAQGDATPDGDTPDDATPDDADPDNGAPDNSAPDDATPDDPTPSAERSWARSFAVVMGMAALVAAGVSDRGWAFPLIVLATAALGFGLLFRLFPGKLDFAFGTAIGFAVYACLFTLIGRSATPDARNAELAAAFLLPVAVFLGAVYRQGGTVLDEARDEERFAGEHVWRTGRWLGVLGLVGAGSLSLPINRLPAEGQGVALLLLMAVVGGLVAWSVRDIVRFLVDIALLLHDLTRRLGTLAVPAATYVALYALLAITFACLYRIADGLSLHPLFAGTEGSIRLSFTDALHFSVTTLSTVGYGDIRPADDGARLLSAVEVVAGQILLLFGFYEIMNSRRVNRALKDGAEERVVEQASPPDGQCRGR
ncbi:potassium channel family protein [Roseomonas sp. BN140053]|uniref:potassium channel family protein n=1 Tax=Roseomonas sp. BN140053 TaxID=3391898 RepID=UPI0039EAF54A